jgi:hypothetical protein
METEKIGCADSSVLGARRQREQAGRSLQGHPAVPTQTEFAGSLHFLLSAITALQGPYNSLETACSRPRFIYTFFSTGASPLGRRWKRVTTCLRDYRRVALGNKLLLKRKSINVVRSISFVMGIATLSQYPSAGQIDQFCSYMG